jgi:hypothetical protein
MDLLKKFFPISIIPLLVLALGIFMFLFFDPFYSRAIDPEFPYLVNGLNVALLKFNYIGHYDHPGTPFQVFNGIVIQITHLFTGKASIAQDVFSRPEHYLNAISAFLLFLQAALIFAVGLLGIKRNIAYWQILILQASCFFNDVLVWLFCRVNPDRFFMIIGLLLILVYLKHGYEKRSTFKFALWSGVVMGLGMATKFNFLPVLLFPLLVIETNKNRLIYAGTCLTSFFIFISPIITKFDDFFSFITLMFKHDGLYGSGEAQVLNISKMMGSITEIFRINPSLYLLIPALIASIVIAYRKRNDGMLKFVVLFCGFLLIIAMQMLMVSKHFKNYYLAPTFILYGIFFFSISVFLSKLIADKSRLVLMSSILPCFFILSTAFQVKSQYIEISQTIEQREDIRKFVNSNITKDDIWFVEPTWEGGPYAENAMVYGLSYCGHREDYTPQLKAINPNVITYEGNNNQIKVWRCAPASLDSVMSTKKNIYIFSTSGRQAPVLMQMLQEAASGKQMPLLIDTVYANKETKNEIIKINAIESEFSTQPINDPLSLRKKRIAEFVQAIKASTEWLELVKKKAIINNVPIDTMILRDAIYMTDNEKK